MTSAVSVVLRIEPELCGPISIGTVSVVKLLIAHLGLSLRLAKDYVDRCVFEAEAVNIPAPSEAAARSFVAAVSALPEIPRIEAMLRDS